MLRLTALFVVALVLGGCRGDGPGDTALEDSSRDARFVRWESPSASVVTAFSDRAFQLSEVLQRTARFFSAIATSYEEDNEVDTGDRLQATDKNGDDTPSSALDGMYSECVLRLSVPCIQRKLLLFLDRLGRLNKFRLLGDFLSVVRVEPRDAGDNNQTTDNDHDDSLAERFFETHSVRFSLPGTLRLARSPGLRTTVDLHFSRVIPDKDNVGEGRGPLSGGSGGGGSSKKKQKMIKKIKKKLMKILMMLMSVMMVMGPMMGGMAGGQAMLAMVMGSLSLLISKALIIHKLGGSVTGLLGNIGSSIGNLAGIAGGGGGQGGGGSSYFPSGTGGGPYSRVDPVAMDWARSFGNVMGGSFDPMALVYSAHNVASYLK